jgi:hypothetical protein
LAAQRLRHADSPGGRCRDTFLSLKSFNHAVNLVELVCIDRFLYSPSASGLSLMTPLFGEMF